MGKTKYLTLLGNRGFFLLAEGSSGLIRLSNGAAGCEVGEFSSVYETLSPFLFYVGRINRMLSVCPVKEVVLLPFRVVC